MNRSLHIILLLIIAVLFSGCMSTKIILSDKWNPHSPPTYVDYFDTYWFGFAGRPSVAVQKVCLDQNPLAVHRIKTPEDAIITLFTLGIYTPTTVRIWCGE